MRTRRPLLAAYRLVVAGLTLLSSPLSAQKGATPAAKYSAEIRWTRYGIPHVKATNWGGLGYGFAYATAQDAVCTMAKDVVMVNGELSRYFGPIDGNRESDVFHRAVLDSATLRNYPKRQTDRKSVV